MTRTSCLAAILAAAALAACPSYAQDDAATAPVHYTTAEDGSATHNESGATCPATVGDLALAQVYSFDRAEDHLGIACQYLSQLGFTASISIMRIDAADLVGVGGSSERWNRTIYSIWDRYGSVLPYNVDGLEGDESQGLFGALFTLNAQGLPVHIGVWQTDEGEWQFRAQTTFVANSEDWQVAELTRSALLEAKASAN